MINEQNNGPTPDLTITKRKNNWPVVLVIALGVVAFAAWRLWPGSPATSPAVVIPAGPSITNVETGTYSTSTKSIVAAKSVFSQTEDIGFHGIVHHLPANSVLMVILSSGEKNYYFNQLANASPVEDGPFHFVFGQKRPPGTYILHLELFGPDKQKLGEIVQQTITVQ